MMKNSKVLMRNYLRGVRNEKMVLRAQPKIPLTEEYVSEETRLKLEYMGWGQENYS